MITYFLFMPTVRVVSSNLVIIIIIVSKLINGLLHIAKINLKFILLLSYRFYFNDVHAHYNFNDVRTSVTTSPIFQL